MTANGDTADIEALAGHKLVRVRATAASHPNTTGDLLARLARDPSRTVRRIVAARPDTPTNLLQALAADPDRATREAVAANPRTPADVLIALLSDSNWQVRYAVAANPAADLNTRHAMCTSADPDVRRVLAQQSNLPAQIAARLAQDPARQVRETLAGCTDHPAVLQTLLNDPEPDVRAAAGLHEGTTTTQRRHLVHDPIAHVRSSVVHAMASHGWDIPQEDLLLLARDRSTLVRYWLATLPGSTRPVYQVLADDPDETVATAARAWLMAPDNPANTAQLPDDEVLGGLAVQGHFTNPTQLGRPIPKVREDALNGLMDRLRNSP